MPNPNYCNGGKGAIGGPPPKGTAPMPKLYEALAEAFLAEGVDTQFVLMGDGNMHWSTAFAKLPGVHTVHVRHEHATVAAATAYNVATDKVAVASVTCGPGVTQLMTALPAAVRARLPMVVFAGEPPINAKFYNQYIDQAPLVTATGAHYIAAHSVPRMMDCVREAFHIAKYERRPVVLGIPYDLQKVEHMANQPYETSAMYQPKVGRIHPDPEVVAEAVERLAAANRPIVLGGRGVLWSGARDAVIKLADRCGALLSNTLPARGLFHDHPFGLGTTGSYFTSLGREMYESADVVLAVGTSLSYYVGGGHDFAKACKIQLEMPHAACAMGRRPPTSTSDRMRSSASRHSLPASTRSWALANRGGGYTHERAGASHRDRASGLMPFDIAPGLLDPRGDPGHRASFQRTGTSSAAAIRPISTPRCVAGRRSATRRSVNSARSATACRMRLGLRLRAGRAATANLLFEATAGSFPYPGTRKLKRQDFIS